MKILPAKNYLKMWRLCEFCSDFPEDPDDGGWFPVGALTLLGVLPFGLLILGGASKTLKMAFFEPLEL